MKRFFFVILVVFIMSSCYTLQPVTFTDEEFSKVYDDVIGTKNDLYLKANTWMVSFFKDAKSIIQHSDKEQGVIIGKYLMKEREGYNTNLLILPGLENIYSTINIQVKDNKARISIRPYDYTFIKKAAKKTQYTKEDALKDMEVLTERFHQALKAEESEF